MAERIPADTDQSNNRARDLFQSLRLPNGRWLFLALAIVLFFRLLVQVALYQAGFNSLTADEFGRTIIAANWSKHPVLYWNGLWLPFHAYLMGMALKIDWDLLWLPRIITILTGLISIVLLYLLTANLFKSQLVGLVSAILVSVNPVHIWLSGTPLTDMPNAMLLLAGIWSFSVYLEAQKRGYLFLSAFALAIANGFRYESWLVSALFTLMLLGMGLSWFVKKKVQKSELVTILIAACLPWLFPLAWALSSFTASGNVLSFLDGLRSYHIQRYGEATSYANYLETFLRIDPYLTILGIIALVASLYRNKRSLAVNWYVAVATIPLVMNILMQGGQVEPAGNYLRYFGLFSFLLYPAMSFLIVSVAQALPSRLFKIGVLLFLILVMVTQLRTAFKFTNDPAGAGLAVGEAIRELRIQHPEIADRPVMVELSYWQYLAIQVGANDVDRILFDRVPDVDTHKTQSLLLTDSRQFQACLQAYQVSYIIVKDPLLKASIESDYGISTVEEVNGYAFYAVKDDLLNYRVADQFISCPLIPGFDR